MPDNDVYSVSPQLTYNGQNCTNVLHFVQQGADGAGDPRQQLVDMFSFNYATLYRGLMVIGVAYDTLNVRRVGPTETQTLISSIASNGTHAGLGMPTHSAALIRQRGDGATERRGTGGQKIVGVPFAVVSAGRITAAYNTLLQAYGALGEVDQVFSGWTWRQCIMTAAKVPQEIFQTSVSPRLVTVRSRQIGVGA